MKTLHEIYRIETPDGVGMFTANFWNDVYKAIFGCEPEDMPFEPFSDEQEEHNKIALEKVHVWNELSRDLSKTTHPTPLEDLYYTKDSPIKETPNWQKLFAGYSCGSPNLGAMVSWIDNPYTIDRCWDSVKKNAQALYECGFVLSKYNVEFDSENPDDYMYKTTIQVLFDKNRQIGEVERFDIRDIENLYKSLVV